MSFRWFGLALLFVSVGCARPPEPRHVRAAELGKLGPLAPGQPLVIEFDEGEVIPMRFTLDGVFVKSAEDAPQIPLRVVRHFYLRIDKDGLRSSLDGKSFDAKPVAPGKFRIGVGVEAGKPLAEVSITTPVPRGVPAP